MGIDWSVNPTSPALPAAPCPSDDLVSLRLAAGPDSAAIARRAVARLEADLEQGCLDTLRLLTTELVTNSVRHAAAAAVDLRVHVTAERVRLEVRDEGPGFEPRGRRPGQSRAGGWGLYLVARLAHRWGVTDHASGTHVWLELDRTA